MNNRRGFTLAESMIAYTTLSVLVLGALQIMDVEWKSFQANETASSLRLQIVSTFTRMERELKSTTPTQINLAGGATAASLTFKVPQDNDADGTVLDADGNIEWSADIVYALNNTNQLTRTSAGATSVLANNVTNLQFTRPAAQLEVLQITLAASRATSTGRLVQDTEQVTIKMRN